jgi:hypothetical protein
MAYSHSDSAFFRSGVTLDPLEHPNHPWSLFLFCHLRPLPEPNLGRGRK